MAFSFETLQTSLSRAKLRGRLGHAILIVGEEELEKIAAATFFAAMLLCENCTLVNETINPCGNCADCLQIESHRHSNVDWVRASESDEIRIDQIRDVRERLHLSSFNDRARLIILANANVLTTGAANALLKSLEEPSPGRYFLLLATSSAALPQTLLSRCQRLVGRGFKTEDSATEPDDEISRFADNLLARILSSDLNSRIFLVEEITKHSCDKPRLLFEIQKRLHVEFRKAGPSTGRPLKNAWLKPIEATENARLALSHNANLQLTLENWLLNTWPVANQ